MGRGNWDTNKYGHCHGRDNSHGRDSSQPQVLTAWKWTRLLSPLGDTSADIYTNCNNAVNDGHIEVQQQFFNWTLHRTGYPSTQHHPDLPTGTTTTTSKDDHFQTSEGRCCYSTVESQPLQKGWEARYYCKTLSNIWDWEKTRGRKRPPSTPRDRETLPSPGADWGN